MKKSDEKMLTSKEVVQSYLLTTAGRDWGMYAERFLLKLIEMAQSEIQSMNFKDGSDLMHHDPKLEFPGVLEVRDDDVLVCIPVVDLLDSRDSKNHSYVRKTVELLQKQVLTWESPEYDEKGVIVYTKDGRVKRKWESVQLIGRAEGDNERDSYIRVKVDKKIWKAMVDFSAGFRAYDLDIAYSMKSKYAFRLYQLMSRQSRPLTFSVDELKRMWNLGKSYENTGDFENKVIKKAKEELDAKSPYTFDYVKNTAPGSKKIVSYTFFPKHQLHLDTPKNTVAFDESQMFDVNVRKILKDVFKFNWVDIHAAYDILYAGKKCMTGEDEDHPDLYSFLVSIQNKALSADNVRGYVVSSLKVHLRERYDVVVTRKKDAVVRTPRLKVAGDKSGVGKGIDSGMDRNEVIKVIRAAVVKGGDYKIWQPVMDSYGITLDDVVLTD